MGKKHTFELKDIKISFHCSKCDKVHEVKINEYDLGHSEGECELCGSHGSIWVDLKCPGCGLLRDIELRSW